MARLAAGRSTPSSPRRLPALARPVGAGDHRRRPGAGLAVLEDLGDGLYAALIARRPADEAPLYDAAIDALVALHAAAPPPC